MLTVFEFYSVLALNYRPILEIYLFIFIFITYCTVVPELHHNFVVLHNDNKSIPSFLPSFIHPSIHSSIHSTVVLLARLVVWLVSAAISRLPHSEG